MHSKQCKKQNIVYRVRGLAQRYSPPAAETKRTRKNKNTTLKHS